MSAIHTRLPGDSKYPLFAEPADDPLVARIVRGDSAGSGDVVCGMIYRSGESYYFESRLAHGPTADEMRAIADFMDRIKEARP